MKKLKLLLPLLIAWCLTASSQNLVPNNSFENYDSTYSATIFPFFNRTFESIEDWRVDWPMFNTPDLFFENSYMFFEDVSPFSLSFAISLYNTGLGVNYASMPTNYAGFQYPRTGGKYIGIRSETPTSLDINGNLQDNPFHEYIQVKLNDTLEEGKSYRVSIFVSSAENNIIQNNAIDILLSEENEFELGTVPITPSISATDSTISSEEWTELTGIYFAQGGESFITIGNLDLSATDTFIVDGQFNSIYYYVDDVSVFENRLIDTTLCPNESIILRANPESNTHLWQDGSTDSIFTVTEEGTYWYAGTYDNIIHADTFIINYYEPLSINTISDTTICYNDSIELTVNHNFENVEYNWSTGETTNSITVSEAGQYTISVRNLCEKQADFVVINKVPKIEFELGNDTTLCNGENLLLTPQINQGQYSWQDGSSELIYTANNTDQYWLTINNECESVSDTINVKILDKLILDLGPDLEICQFPITLDVTNENAQYLWHDGSYDNSITIEDSSLVWVNVYNYCESLYDTILLNHFCGCEFYIPSSFTPNGDNINDSFKIIVDSQCQLKKYSLSIFNRWGQDIFYSENINEKWHGNYKNQLIQNGIYIYSINYQFYGEPRKRILGKVLLKN